MAPKRRAMTVRGRKAGPGSLVKSQNPGREPEDNLLCHIRSSSNRWSSLQNRFKKTNSKLNIFAKLPWPEILCCASPGRSQSRRLPPTELPAAGKRRRRPEPGRRGSIASRGNLPGNSRWTPRRHGGLQGHQDDGCLELCPSRHTKNLTATRRGT